MSTLVIDHDFAGIPVSFGAVFTQGEMAPTWLLVRNFGLRILESRKTDHSLVRMTDDLLCHVQTTGQDESGGMIRQWTATKPSTLNVNDVQHS